MKNERDKIDNLFRQKLEGYQVNPSGKVWKNIMNRFIHPHAGPFHLLNLQNIIGTLLLIGAGITTYLIWPASTESETATVKGMASDLITLSQSDSDQTSSNSYQADIPREEKSAAQNENSIEIKEDDLKVNPLHKNENAAPETPEQTISGNKKTPPSAESGMNEFRGPENMSVTTALQSVTRMPPLGSPFLLNEAADLSRLDAMNEHHQKAHESIRLRKADYRDPAQFSAGIHFLPEWTDYRTDPGTFQSSYTQEILASVQLGDFILRSGLGINRSQDDGNYQVNYSKYEMTGYYIGMTFEDGINPVYDSINYVVDEHGLYDTVYYNESYRTDNTYTYLQIPLQIGYKFLSYKRFSLDIAGGPCLSLLLNEKKSDPSFSDYAAENITMRDQTPVRRSSNWQFLLGLNAQYLITGRIGLTLEPTYRQYFKPVYEGNGPGWPPYSLGIRAGITFHF